MLALGSSLPQHSHQPIRPLLYFCNQSARPIRKVTTQLSAVTQLTKTQYKRRDMLSSVTLTHSTVPVVSTPSDLQSDKLTTFSFIERRVTIFTFCYYGAATNDTE